MSDGSNDKNCRITLYIDTPQPMLNPLKDPLKHNPAEAWACGTLFNVAAVTGHAFVGLTDKNGKEERWGYTAEEFSVAGMVFRGTPGVLIEHEPGDYYNEAIVWNISEKQFHRAKNAIEKLRKRPGNYKLFEKNCATVASDILRAADVPDVPGKKLGLTPYGLALKKRVMLAKRRMEVMKFRVKNTIGALFGKKKAPATGLMRSLRSQPVPVPIDNAMKVFRDNRKREVSEQIDLKRVLNSISRHL